MIHLRAIIYVASGALLVAMVSFFFLRKSIEQEKKRQCYGDLLTFCSRIERNIPDNAVVFIGDSHVHGLCVAAVTAYGVNLGIGGDTTTGVLHRLKQYHFQKKIRALVVAVGGNDIIQGKQEGISGRYEAIIASIPESIPVLLTAICPVNEDNTQKIDNRSIHAVNTQIASVCSRYDNCYYRDLNDTLLDATGKLSSLYHDGDGLHLNAQGYQMWINELKHVLADF